MPRQVRTATKRHPRVSSRAIRANSGKHLEVRKAAMLTAYVGIAHAILLIFSFGLLRAKGPGPNPTDDELITFYADADNRRIILFAGLYLLPFAGIAFIWFNVALRMWINASAKRRNILLSNVEFVAGIIYTTLMFAAGASMSVTATTVELTDSPIDAVSAREFPQYGTALLLIFAMRMAAMFVFLTSNMGRSSGILPRWFVWIGFVVGICLLLTASLSTWLILVFPVWILVFSGILLNRVRRIPKDLVITGQATAEQRAIVDRAIRRRSNPAGS